jgi:LuxR family transcriptional regulator, maltose regulon positive regulatory protein
MAPPDAPTPASRDTTHRDGGGAALERGRAALTRGAWEDALEALTAAVAAEPENGVAWEALGNACMWLQHTDRQIEARQRAYAVYREEGADASAARVCLDLVWDYLEVRGEAAVANGWFQRARRLLEGLPTGPEHALLGIFHAFMLLDSDPAAAEAHAREAAAIAERVGAADMGVLALALHGLALVTEGRVAEGLSLLDEALAGALGREVTDPQWFYFTCCCMIDACDRVGDFGRSLEWCHQLRAFAERWRVQAFLTTCRIKYTRALLWRGEWAAYEAELEHAAAELAASRPTAVPGALVRLAELRRRQGRRREAEQLLERARTHPLALPVRIGLALDAGDAAGALELVDLLLRRTPAAAVTERVVALETKARAHAALGQLEAARAAAAELVGVVERVGTPALRAAAHAAGGVVAAAAAEHERARELLEDAVHLLEAAGSRHEAARARIDLARSLAAVGREDRAVAELDEALRTLDALGAAGDARRARDLVARLEARGDAAQGRRDRRPDRGGALTRRQQEILALVAQGLSDREIAGRLFLSEHTVHRHMANVLGRLGVSTRTAAVAQALRGDML